MSSFPSIRGEKHDLFTIPGEPPNLLKPPAGCRFHPRCPYASETCEQNEPALELRDERHSVACWHPVKEKAKVRAS